MFNWLKRLLNKQPHQPFALSEQQVETLQQLYFVMDFERETLNRHAPELMKTWEQFTNLKGQGWHWFPKHTQLQHSSLKEIVEQNSMYFEQTNALQLTEGDAYDYRLVGPAIIATDGTVVCRGKVELVVIDDSEGDFLAALENL